MTKEMYAEALKELKPQIENAMYEDGDYLLIEAHVFNAGGYYSVESVHYIDYEAKVSKDEVTDYHILIDKMDVQYELETV